MILRIPQRTQDDCAICTVAMVMGPSVFAGEVACLQNAYKSSDPQKSSVESNASLRLRRCVGQE
jgi:hypothetical protein